MREHQTPMDAKGGGAKGGGGKGGGGGATDGPTIGIDARQKVEDRMRQLEGKLAEPSAFDISPKGPGTNDPMYIVEATRA